MYDIKGAICRLRDIKQEFHLIKTDDNDFNFWLIMLENDIEKLCERFEKNIEK